MNEVYGYVYMVKNLVNGKIYFGITVNDFKKRYSGDISKYTHNDHLKRSINKYGIENFEINEQFDVAYNEDDLWDLEDMYICLYDTIKNGYNERRSGSKHKGRGHFEHTEETKHKLSEAMRGEKNPNYGKQHTEEHKRKLSETMKGEKNPNYGKQMSEEQKHKISEARKCQTLSEEHKQKIGQSIKGSKNGNAHKVICLETGQVFDCLVDAKKWCGLGSHTSISENCKKKRKSAGKHPITSEKLHWMYYDEWLIDINNKNEQLIA